VLRTLAWALLVLSGCHTALQRDFSTDPEVSTHEPDRDAAVFADAGSPAPGEPCVQDDARVCASERQPLVCNGHAWQLDVPCEADERCEVEADAGPAHCALRHDFSGGQLSGGGATSCAIDAAGALYCWGARLGTLESDLPRADAGTPARVGSERWRAVAVGDGHACAIRADGTLWCWGSNCAGQLGAARVRASVDPLQVGSATDWERVAAGAGVSCALDADGALACWGGAPGAGSCSRPPTAGFTPVPVAGTWQDAAIGGAAVYALAGDGALFRLGELGAVATSQPPQRIGRARFRIIDAGPTSVCGVRDDGTLACADAAAVAETAIGERNDWGLAIAVDRHVCATRVDGTLWCLGPNDSGQLGSGAVGPDVAAPVQVGHAPGWVAVSAQRGGSCGVRDGRVHCWGANGEGELGIGDQPVRFAPAQVGREQGWSQPTVGRDFSCALHGRELRCWGADDRGQLGSLGASKQLTPLAVPGSFLDAEAGASGACAIGDSHALSCWASAGGAALAAALQGLTVAALGTGDGPCAVLDDGAAWCATATGDAAAAVGELAVRAIASSGTHACAIAVDGALSCWGANADGQLGLGTTSVEEPPTEIAGGGRWLSVSVAPNGCSCAITDEGAAGRLYCWGSGASGCLGDGGEQGASAPQQVGSASDFRKVAMGPSRGCAVDRQGALYCWGDNRDGGLGIGSADATLHTPSRIAPEQIWQDVAVSASHACATTSEGTLWCWGTGPSGELGEDSALRLPPTPIAL
jgi:alpha-tubulin suppressor-like RCC1 family protein